MWKFNHCQELQDYKNSDFFDILVLFLKDVGLLHVFHWVFQILKILYLLKEREIGDTNITWSHKEHKNYFLAQ